MLEQIRAFWFERFLLHIQDIPLHLDKILSRGWDKYAHNQVLQARC